MADVQLRSIRKSFGGSVALADLSLDIASGELVCLLGPSGCGKTTALRILAGFEKADEGSVHVGGQDVTDSSPQARRFGMVFQDYSLFPNMTARQNIEFGLKVARRDVADRKRTVDRMIEITVLADHADKYPHQMSGGQKQRVALARAIATAPRVLLLDEPLSALDAKVREALREEVRRLQQEIGVTTVFVTHDQHEALAIADRVGVMSNGRLEQLAAPRDLYENPVNAFVAGFIGTVNRLPALGQGDGRWRVLARMVPGPRPAQAGQRDTAVVRPEQVAVDRHATGADIVESISFLGPLTRLVIAGPEHGRVLVDVVSADAADLSPGAAVNLRLRDDVRSVVLTGIPMDREGGVA